MYAQGLINASGDPNAAETTEQLARFQARIDAEEKIEAQASKIGRASCRERV